MFLMHAPGKNRSFPFLTLSTTIKQWFSLIIMYLWRCQFVTKTHQQQQRPVHCLCHLSCTLTARWRSIPIIRLDLILYFPRATEKLSGTIGNKWLTRHRPLSILLSHISFAFLFNFRSSLLFPIRHDFQFTTVEGTHQGGSKWRSVGTGCVPFVCVCVVGRWQYPFRNCPPGVIMCLRRRLWFK